MKSFKKIETENYDTAIIQDNIEETFKSVSVDLENLMGQIIEDISITTGTPKTVEHKIGREPTGYDVIKKSANATIWDSQSSNNLKTRTLILNSSANVTISIRVF